MLPNKADSPLKVPVTFWNMLDQEDKNEYLTLRDSFHNSTSRERHGNSIQGDLQTIRNYIDRKEQGKEIRSIVAGIAFSGTFVCVNTSQLKNLLGRCKSSINNGFLLLGYASAKTKVRQCIISMMPSLLKDSSLLKQWTLRCKETTSFPHTIDEEKKIRAQYSLTSSSINSSPQSTNYSPNTRVAILANFPHQNSSIKRSPFPTPMINGFYFKKDAPESQKPAAVSLPKPMPMFDISSPTQSVDLSLDMPFFDLPSPTVPPFALPSSAPRPISMPAFPSGPDFFDDPAPPPYFDESSLPFAPDDLNSLPNDTNEWSRYGDTFFP